MISCSHTQAHAETPTHTNTHRNSNSIRIPINNIFIYVSMYISLYTYINTCTHIHTYAYRYRYRETREITDISDCLYIEKSYSKIADITYRARKRKRERERELHQEKPEKQITPRLPTSRNNTRCLHTTSLPTHNKPAP